MCIPCLSAWRVQVQQLLKLLCNQSCIEGGHLLATQKLFIYLGSVYPVRLGSLHLKHTS